MKNKVLYNKWYETIVRAGAPEGEIFSTEYEYSSTQQQQYELHYVHYTCIKRMELGFPRDGTSGCPFVPGQKSFPVPLSLCPGTKKFCLSRCPFVPGQGQEQMSQDKLLCPGTSQDKITFSKETKKQDKDVLRQERAF